LVTNFNNLKIPISGDVLEVYSNLGGMDDFDSEGTCFSFWSVEKILAEDNSKAELTFFADFLIYFHLYGFKFENDKTSSIHIYWGEKQIEKIANSFEDFFEIFLTVPEKH